MRRRFIETPAPDGFRKAQAGFVVLSEKTKERDCAAQALRAVDGAALASSLLARSASAKVVVEDLKGSSPPPLRGLIRKGYADSTWGQIHYRMVSPATPSARPPIVFFHPNPFSGAYFNYTLEELGRD